MLNKLYSFFYKVKYRNGYKITRILCFRFKKKYTALENNINLNTNEKDNQKLNKVILPRPNIPHVGKCTYCNDDLFIASKETVIGSFCSIGPRVVLGCGKHPIHMLSTSPYLYLDIINYKDEAFVSHNEFLYLEPIHIGNDVWIGDGVFVKNGITIGDGAIIGAHAVVTKDVPPYAVVVGSPAKIIKYRFDSHIVEELLKLRWWDLDDKTIKKIPYDNINSALDFIRKERKQ